MFEPEREEGSMTYDKEVLDQHSDPTSNSMDPQFSLGSKLFFPEHKFPETKMENLFKASGEGCSLAEQIRGATAQAGQHLQGIGESRSQL